MRFWHCHASIGRDVSRFFTSGFLRRAGITVGLAVAFMAAFGQTDLALQRGVTWLNTQVQPDGSFASAAASSGTQYQAQSEAALTLAKLSQPIPAALITGLQTAQAAQAELLARQIAAAKASGSSFNTAQAQLALLQLAGSGIAPQAGDALLRPGSGGPTSAKYQQPRR